MQVSNIPMQTNAVDCGVFVCLVRQSSTNLNYIYGVFFIQAVKFFIEKRQMNFCQVNIIINEKYKHVVRIG